VEEQDTLCNQNKLETSRTEKGEWKNNIKMDLTEIGCDTVDWIHVDHDEVVTGCYEHSNEPSGSIKEGKFLD
jgi:hypothetical protein